MEAINEKTEGKALLGRGAGRGADRVVRFEDQHADAGLRRAPGHQRDERGVGALRRDEFHARYGPTQGDRIRVGDSDLWLTIEEDRQAHGDEPQWGYGKTIRLRQAQSESAGPSELDTVIVGAVIVDPVVGVVKADIGIKDGRIVGIGAAGNPGISDGIDLVIGPHTEPIIAYGLIATPGVVDSHVHLITPKLIPTALAAGVTTLITAGFEEPPWAMERTLRSFEEWPINLGLQANARTGDEAALDALLDAGAVGFKIHEDYGAYPSLIDRVLGYADAHDVSVVAPHGRAERVGRARGHGRRDPRADRPRVPRRGCRRRARA